MVANIRLDTTPVIPLGFALDVGNVNDQVQAFADLINRCGGIHGRQLKIVNITVPAVPPNGEDSATLEQAACIQATEDDHAAIAFTTTGFGGAGVPCITAQHHTIFIGSATLQQLAASHGTLFSTDNPEQSALTYMALQLVHMGQLKGKVVGIVTDDSSTDAQVVQQGLVEVLRNQLHVDVARVDTLGCQGGIQCAQGLASSVRGMIADHVNVLFPMLNVLSLPAYIKELAAQGVAPGQIHIYQSDYQFQNTDLVSGQVPLLGGTDAGKLYDGTEIISANPTGLFRKAGFQPSVFSQMCYNAYAHNGHPPIPYSATNEATVSQYGQVVFTCTIMRIIARAIDAAGPNPTQDDIAQAMAHLGPIDEDTGLSGSFKPGNKGTPDTLYTLVFHDPCPVRTANKSGSCVLSQSGPYPNPTGP